MSETCNVVRQQTEDACIPSPKGGCTWQSRVVQTLWCVDDTSGQGQERTQCGDWEDSGKPCTPQQGIGGGGAA